MEKSLFVFLVRSGTPVIGSATEELFTVVADTEKDAVDELKSRVGKFSFEFHVAGQIRANDIVDAMVEDATPKRMDPINCAAAIEYICAEYGEQFTTAEARALGRVRRKVVNTFFVR